VLLLVLGGIYLAVNAKLARAGREVLVLEAKRTELMRKNGELMAGYAELRSPDLMLERAVSLGFEPADPEQIEFVEIEGFAGEQPFIAPRPLGTVNVGETMLSPAYTETLGDLFSRWLNGGS
jgi:choline dehydrogenase-like flavoprotein